MARIVQQDDVSFELFRRACHLIATELVRRRLAFSISPGHALSRKRSLHATKLGPLAPAFA